MTMESVREMGSCTKYSCKVYGKTMNLEKCSKIFIFVMRLYSEKEVNMIIFINGNIMIFIS